MSDAPALMVRGLTRRFGQLVAIDDLNLSVLPGDVYGFLGPNGSGKTTSMRCMLGLIQRDAGEVSFFGETDPLLGRSLVGAIIETPAFHTWLSGRKNLELAAAYAGVTRGRVQSEIERVLERVGLRERARDRVGTYSLGMKQRLAIARALLGRPRLLMLDEPTNGLDPAGMKEMRDLVRSLALHDRITVFISSHLLAEVEAICTRVGILKNGKLRAEGRVDALLGQGGGETTVEVAGEEDGPLDAALARVAGVTVLGPGGSGRRLVRLDGIGAADLNVALLALGVRVSALIPAHRNLEDVFMEVTR
jgi:ABC-type multidrug transport system ATPase subunit